MPLRNRARLVARWDRSAARYDEGSAALERRFLAAARLWVCERIVGEPLEVAVGTGTNFAHYPAGTPITGIEWSPAMVDRARAKADALGRAADLRVGDAEALPFGDASFDTVLCTFALCSVPDERAALAEAVRVLRPGGRLLLADHVVSTTWWVRAAQRAADLVSVPRQNEHFTRRPLLVVQALGLDIVDTRRDHYGAIECVHATRPR